MNLRPFLAALALACAAGPARATWSIVALDRSTGEVLVVSATCLADFDLIRYLPVVVVGEGAAAAQSFIDVSGANRQRIFDGLMQGDSPAEILALLEQSDANHQTRQYGIVGQGGVPVTFTGTGAGLAATGAIGRVGTIEYAIQGNVLTGDVVVTACEDAFVHTQGDMVQRAMAGMQAARAYGGDGRCSCDANAPTSCGAPPPSFDKSAHTAFIVVARLGDVDGDCDTQDGCASGSYYLRRRAIGGVSDPDPMVELERRVARWRENKSVLADHFLTEVEPEATHLPADGTTSTTVHVRLVNLDGTPLTFGGQILQIDDVSVGGPLVSVGPATDHGDGTHAFAVTAGARPGLAQLRIRVQDGSAAVRLFPDLELVLEPAADLFCGRAEVSATAAAPVPLTVQRDAAEAGRLYRILCSASGDAPGTSFGGLLVPLNDDRVLRWSLGAGPPLFVGAAGTLDGAGRAQAVLATSPALLLPFLGQRIDFCAVLGGGPDEHTAVDGFEVVP